MNEVLRSARFEPVTAMLVCCQVFSEMFRYVFSGKLDNPEEVESRSSKLEAPIWKATCLQTKFTKKKSIPWRSVIGRFHGRYRRQDKGITNLRIDGNYSSNGPAAHRTTLESSATLLWEHHISHQKCFLLNLSLSDKMVWRTQGGGGGNWESLPQFKTYLEA